MDPQNHDYHDNEPNSDTKPQLKLNRLHENDGEIEKEDSSYEDPDEESKDEPRSGSPLPDMWNQQSAKRGDGFLIFGHAGVK